MKRYVSILSSYLVVAAVAQAQTYYGETVTLKPTFAMAAEEWRALKQRDNLALVPSHEPEAVEIEVWSYDPSLFAQNGLADRLSVYLSLKDSKDERIDAALAEMLEGLRW